MKNTMKCLGIIAIVAVIGFTFSLTLTSCDDGSSGPGGGGGNSLSGSYYYDNYSLMYVTFYSSGSCTLYILGSSYSGTYRFDGRNITSDYSSYGTFNWTYVNSTTIRDRDGDNWYKR